MLYSKICTTKAHCRVDTAIPARRVTSQLNFTAKRARGRKKCQPIVFAGLKTVEGSKFLSAEQGLESGIRAGGMGDLLIITQCNAAMSIDTAPPGRLFRSTKINFVDHDELQKGLACLK